MAFGGALGGGAGRLGGALASRSRLINRVLGEGIYNSAGLLGGVAGNGIDGIEKGAAHVYGFFKAAGERE